MWVDWTKHLCGCQEPSQWKKWTPMQGSVSGIYMQGDRDGMKRRSATRRSSWRWVTSCYLRDEEMMTSRSLTDLPLSTEHLVRSAAHLLIYSCTYTHLYNDVFRCLACYIKSRVTAHTALHLTLSGFILTTFCRFALLLYLFSSFMFVPSPLFSSHLFPFLPYPFWFNL